MNSGKTRKKISIVTPTFNEADNLTELCDRIENIMLGLPYDYEHIIIDNASTDRTLELLRIRAASDSRLKVIINTRNFGHIRSPYHAVLQADGSAVIVLASDLQDPPEIITELLARWEDGYKIVMTVKKVSEESHIINFLRRRFYRVLQKVSEVPLVENATGAGLYDATVTDLLRKIDDPYPYFRGLVCEIGFPIATVEFPQPKRKRGVSSQSLYSLFDIAMLGAVKHSKLPLRIMTFIGFSTALVSFFVGLFYFIYKLFFWNEFEAGQAPLVVGLFFFMSLLMIFLGVIGEYLLSIQDHVRKLPHVVERERINFDDDI